jgi:outer membrane protein assembly factor BamB
LLPAGLILLAALTPALAANWPQWRGPKGDGHSPETNLPTQWGPDSHVVWKAKLPGRGASTPCVWGDRIFLTALGGGDVALLCLGTDGKQKWKRDMGPGSQLYRNGEGDAASASCSTDGKHVWAFAGNGKLGCYDFDGKPVWEIDAADKYGKFTSRNVIQFGGHWTPVLYKDRLYLQIYHRLGQHLIALDKLTGKEAWKVERKGAGRGESPDTYASPVIWEGDGGPFLISHGNDYCTAHRLTDGSEVWRVTDLNPTDNMHWRFVASPLATPDLIVIPSCKNGPTVGLNPTGAKGTIGEDSPAVLWRLPNFTPDVSCPLRVKDVVYLLSAGGQLTALDAKSGSILHKKDLVRQIHRASPVYADGKIITVGREGTMNVVRPGRAFELLATNKLPDKFYASPAVAGGRIYLRGWQYLWAIGAK